MFCDGMQYMSLVRRASATGLSRRVTALTVDVPSVTRAEGGLRFFRAVVRSDDSIAMFSCFNCTFSCISLIFLCCLRCDSPNPRRIPLPSLQVCRLSWKTIASWCPTPPLSPKLVPSSTLSAVTRKAWLGTSYPTTEPARQPPTSAFCVPFPH